MHSVQGRCDLPETLKTPSCPAALRSLHGIQAVSASALGAARILRELLWAVHTPLGASGLIDNARGYAALAQTAPRKRAVRKRRSARPARNNDQLELRASDSKAPWYRRCRWADLGGFLLDPAGTRRLGAAARSSSG